MLKRILNSANIISELEEQLAEMNKREKLEELQVITNLAQELNDSRNESRVRNSIITILNSNLKGIGDIQKMEILSNENLRKYFKYFIPRNETIASKRERYGLLTYNEVKLHLLHFNTKDGASKCGCKLCLLNKALEQLQHYRDTFVREHIKVLSLADAIEANREIYNEIRKEGNNFTPYQDYLKERMKDISKLSVFQNYPGLSVMYLIRSKNQKSGPKVVRNVVPSNEMLVKSRKREQWLKNKIDQINTQIQKVEETKNILCNYLEMIA